MRKLIVIVAALLAPVAIWTAGCRQDGRQTAFPKGPEVKSLARAPLGDAAARPEPVIAAVIDPEILATPDQPTFARIRAVMDREAQLSSRYDEPGLFVLPPQDYAYNNDMAQHQVAVPAPVPVQVPDLASVPPVSAPERTFWSLPAAPLPASAPGYGPPPPADISAMAPPAPPVDNFEPVMLPEDIPGVYMGIEGDGKEEAPGGFRLFGTAPNRPDGTWEGGTSALPPLLSGDEFASISVDELNTAMREAGGIRPRPQSAFGGKTPAALPSLPALAAGPASTGVSEKVAAMLNGNDIRAALSPLPDLAAAPATGGGRPLPAAVPGLALPPPMPSAVAHTVAPTAQLPLPVTKNPAGKTQRDIYLTDFWENRVPAVAGQPDAHDLAMPKSILDFEFALPALEALPDPWNAETPPADAAAAERVPGPTVEAVSALSLSGAGMGGRDPSSPTPVPMRPILRQPPARTSINQIDSSVDAPPLKF